MSQRCQPVISPASWSSLRAGHLQVPLGAFLQVADLDGIALTLGQSYLEVRHGGLGLLPAWPLRFIGAHASLIHLASETQARNHATLGMRRGTDASTRGPP